MVTTTRPKPFAFVLMPFSADFDDIYQLGIRAACEAAGAYAERVDEQVFDGTILQRVYNQIAKADIVVAEMSGTFFSDFAIRRNKGDRDRYQLYGRTVGGRALKIIFQLKPGGVVRIITGWPI